jgi:acetyltransferase-like isoleucine patch superfamily enzyme
VWLASVPGGIGSWLRRHLYGFESCGDDVLLGEGFWVEFPGRLSIGEHVTTNKDCYINAGGGVTVGDWALIGPGALIYSQNHRIDGIDMPVSMAGYDFGPVVIDADVWIGARAIVLPGVTIGRGAVVAAGAVVSNDVEPRSVVAGVPARHVRYREETE